MYLLSRNSCAYKCDNDKYTLYVYELSGRWPIRICISYNTFLEFTPRRRVVGYCSRWSDTWVHYNITCIWVNSIIYSNNVVLWIGGRIGVDNFSDTKINTRTSTVKDRYTINIILLMLWIDFNEGVN